MLIESASPSYVSGTPPNRKEGGGGGEKPFQRVLINDIKGYGLIATKPLKAGTQILSDQFVFADDQEQVLHPTKGGEDRKAIETTIRRKVNAMGPGFTRRYLELPPRCDDDLREGKGVYARIWFENSLQFRHNGQKASLVGPNVGWVNHSCFPNAHLALVVYSYSKGWSSNLNCDCKVTAGTTTKVHYRAVLRACRDIPKGQEITRAYDYQTLPMVARQLYLEATYGFQCACTYCLSQNNELEEFSYVYPQLEKLLGDPIIISTRPALALHAAHAILQGFDEFGIKDLRLPLVWRKCAVLALYHSDLGRAMYFLHQAEKCLVDIEGRFGYHYRQTLNWQECPENVPGFGGTTRGLSGRRDWKIISQSPKKYGSKMLFMLGEKERPQNNYIRLSSYRIALVPSSDKNGDDGDKERLEMVFSTPKLRYRRRRKGTITTTTTTTKTRECIDPEKDFLDVARDFVLNHDQKQQHEGLSGCSKHMMPVPAGITGDNVRKQAVTVGLAMAALDESRGQWDERLNTLQAVDVIRGMDMRICRSWSRER